MHGLKSACMDTDMDVRMEVKSGSRRPVGSPGALVGEKKTAYIPQKCQGLCWNPDFICPAQCSVTKELRVVEACQTHLRSLPSASNTVDTSEHPLPRAFSSASLVRHGQRSGALEGRMGPREKVHFQQLSGA